MTCATGCVGSCCCICDGKHDSWFLSLDEKVDDDVDDGLCAGITEGKAAVRMAPESLAIVDNRCRFREGSESPVQVDWS